jgi:hypothetical protein
VDNSFVVSLIEINPNAQRGDEYEDEVKTSSYEFHGKVDVSGNMFVSRVGTVKTYFLRMEPSKMVHYHLNSNEKETKAVKWFHFHQMDGVRYSKFRSIMALIRDKLKLLTKLCKCKSSFGNKLHNNSIYTRTEKPKLNHHKEGFGFPK